MKRASQSKVREVRVKARSLRIRDMGSLDEQPDAFANAIVWVKPIKGNTPEQVVFEVENLKKAGAVRVLPMPLEAEDAVVPDEAKEQDFGSNVREVVSGLLHMVKEQKEEVEAIVEEALSGVGL